MGFSLIYTKEQQKNYQKVWVGGNKMVYEIDKEVEEQDIGWGKVAYDTSLQGFKEKLRSVDMMHYWWRWCWLLLQLQLFFL